MSRSRFTTGGELNSGTFRRIMESLVESVLYGTEVWGCSRHIQTVEQVKLRGARV